MGIVACTCSKASWEWLRHVFQGHPDLPSLPSTTSAWLHGHGGTHSFGGRARPTLDLLVDIHLELNLGHLDGTLVTERQALGRLISCMRGNGGTRLVKWGHDVDVVWKRLSEDSLRRSAWAAAPQREALTPAHSNSEICTKRSTRSSPTAFELHHVRDTHVLPSKLGPHALLESHLRQLSFSQAILVHMQGGAAPTGCMDRAAYQGRHVAWTGLHAQGRQGCMRRADRLHGQGSMRGVDRLHGQGCMRRADRLHGQCGYQHGVTKARDM
eukprot:364310-Chlamydomonas_euryale.AAC.4